MPIFFYVRHVSVVFLFLLVFLSKTTPVNATIIVHQRSYDGSYSCFETNSGHSCRFTNGFTGSEKYRTALLFGIPSGNYTSAILHLPLDYYHVATPTTVNVHNFECFNSIICQDEQYRFDHYGSGLVVATLNVNGESSFDIQLPASSLENINIHAGFDGSQFHYPGGYDVGPYINYNLVFTADILEASLTQSAVYVGGLDGNPGATITLDSSPLETSVPEPSSLLLVGAGVALNAFLRRRQRPSTVV